jgi:hypothetical protein
MIMVTTAADGSYYGGGATVVAMTMISRRTTPDRTQRPARTAKGSHRRSSDRLYRVHQDFDGEIKQSTFTSFTLKTPRRRRATTVADSRRKYRLNFNATNSRGYAGRS